MDRLSNTVQTLAFFDTHEHLPTEEDRIAERPGILDLFHYVGCDLVAAGAKPEDIEFAFDKNNDIKDRWKRILPFLERSKNTEYRRAYLSGLKLVHGIEDPRPENIAEFDEVIRNRPAKGFYGDTLGKIANIGYIVNDRPDQNHQAPLFVSTGRIDDFLLVDSGKLKSLSLKEGGESYAQAVQALHSLAAGFANSPRHCCVKIPVAYHRSLDFGNGVSSRAESLFQTAVNHPDKVTREDKLELGNCFFHEFMKIASDLSLPVQIHTGLLAGGLRRLQDASPMLLADNLLRYSSVKVSLFHAGFPWTREVGVLAKNFPNVSADLCWVHVISSHVARNTLREWLEYIPYTKILAFGGDYHNVEGSCAHALIARENILAVLRDMVQCGRFSKDLAVDAAERIMQKNGKELFLQTNQDG